MPSAAATSRYAQPAKQCTSSRPSATRRLSDVLLCPSSSIGACTAVDIVAAWPADGFLFVYDGGFNPEEPTDGCLFGNDDDGGIRGSALRRSLDLES